MKHALGPLGLLWVDNAPNQALRRFMDAVRGEARILRPRRKA
jgi:hypothetical protein